MSRMILRTTVATLLAASAIPAIAADAPSKLTR